MKEKSGESSALKNSITASKNHLISDFPFKPWQHKYLSLINQMIYNQSIDINRLIIAKEHYGLLTTSRCHSQL
ncbi:hypothetical protein ABRG53_0583 [Pseudanabaena sp. ABRG5-3]|nr:hypothetical protein ABRG53_0583 [Pseudanabaena sp. ABRG5-3]